MKKENDIETVRLVVLPKTGPGGKPAVTIPKKLNDPWLKKTVELNPDAIVSKLFAEAYCDTYEGYKIISEKDEVNKDLYIINEDYRENDIALVVDNLSPKKKDVVYAFAKAMELVDENDIEDMNEGMTEFVGFLKRGKDGGLKEMGKDVQIDPVKDLDVTVKGPVTEANKIAETKTDNPPAPPKPSLEDCLKEMPEYSPSIIAEKIGSTPQLVGKTLSEMAVKGYVVKEGNVYKPTDMYKEMLKGENTGNAGAINNGGSNS